MSPLFGMLDWIALTVWLGLWIGYLIFSDVHARGRISLVGSLYPIRRLWMRQTLQRQNRIQDAALLGNLMHSATFFSSTTLLILGGILAALGTLDKGLGAVTNLPWIVGLPFAAKQSAALLEAKTFVMLLIFVHAFIRFTWSLRQFNVVCMVMGALPSYPGCGQDPEAIAMADNAAALSELAGDHFAHGLRSYYNAVPVLLWFVHPLLMLASALIITGVIYYMDFRSDTVKTLGLPGTGISPYDVSVTSPPATHLDPSDT